MKMADNYLCACNGLKCEGICKETWLHNPLVKELKICSAAYKKDDKKRYSEKT